MKRHVEGHALIKSEDDTEKKTTENIVSNVMGRRYMAVVSCSKSYQASIEYAVLTTKVLWAMGLATTMSVAV